MCTYLCVCLYILVLYRLLDWQSETADYWKILRQSVSLDFKFTIESCTCNYQISIKLASFNRILQLFLLTLTESYVLLYVCNNRYRIEILAAWNEK